MNLLIKKIEQEEKRKNTNNKKQSSLFPFLSILFSFFLSLSFFF